MATYKRKRRRRLRKAIFIKRLVQLACLIAIVMALIHLISSLGSDKADDVQSQPAAQTVIAPTAEPTVEPTIAPTVEPTVEPVAEATAAPAEEAAPAAETVQEQPQAEAPAVETAQTSNRYPYGALPASAPVDDSYFDDAVFMGDSVMQGFRYDVEYKRKINGSSFGTAQFLTATSYSLYHAVSDRADVAHPTYRGKTQPVQISLRDMGAKKIYIMLGMNDIFVMGVMKSLTNYETLLADIRSECPDAEIYILSVIPCTRNAINKNSKMDIEAITFFNKRLPDFCAEHDCYYVDVASNYLDEDGYLRSEYSSDDYVHIQSGCYDFWAEALRTHTAIIQ